MKNLVLYFLSLLFVGCGSVKDYATFSKQIYKTQKGNNECGVYPKLSLESRKQLVERIDFVSYSNDTVYYLESYYVETGEYYNAIWSKNGIVEFKVYQNNLEYGENYFVPRLYKMVENWDLSGIKKAEKESEGMLGGAMMVGAVIFINNGKLKMDCIQFNEFFNLELDN